MWNLAKPNDWNEIWPSVIHKLRNASKPPLIIAERLFLSFLDAVQKEAIYGQWQGMRETRRMALTGRIHPIKINKPILPWLFKTDYELILLFLSGVCKVD